MKLQGKDEIIDKRVAQIVNENPNGDAFYVESHIKDGVIMIDHMERMAAKTDRNDMECMSCVTAAVTKMYATPLELGAKKVADKHTGTYRINAVYVI